MQAPGLHRGAQGIHALGRCVFGDRFLHRQQVDRGELPLKAWKDCLRCPKFQACDEIAVLKLLRSDAVLPSSLRSPVEDGLIQLPTFSGN